MQNALILTSLLATSAGWAGEPKLTACLPSHPEVNRVIQGLAQGYATRIYRSIGIDLHWKSTCSEAEWNAAGTQFAPNLVTIAIEWAPKAPPTIASEARASARPFQFTGTRISLYLDRLTPVLENRDLASVILGHVLAHEIGHVLLGQNSHSADGLMKAIWTNRDQMGMLRAPMRFTKDQGEKLRQILDNRSIALASVR